MRTIQMDWRKGDVPFFDSLVIGILIATPGNSLAGDPVIFPPMRVDLFDNGIMELPSTQGGDSYAFDSRSWTVRDVDIQKSLFWKTSAKHEPCNSCCIESTHSKVE